MIVNIAKALKLKNQTVRDMKRAYAEVHRNNRYRSDKTPAMDVKPLWEKYLALQQKLFAIKTAICVANAGLAARLNEQQMLRGMIPELESMLPPAGETTSYYDKDRNTIEVPVLAQVTREDLRKRINDAIARIDVLQDEIDEFNAKTKIEIPD